MMLTALPPVSVVATMLRYEPSDATVRWLVPARNNRRNPGDRAGVRMLNGYRKIGVLRAIVLEHRLIWALHHGRWPNGQIDHINGDHTDNRIENLREASHSDNLCNVGLSASNRTGFKGVGFSKRDQKFRARLTKNRAVLLDELFDTPEEAASAYNSYAKQFHGEFARLNDV